MRYIPATKDERNEAIFEYVVKGGEGSAIARDFGITPERARTIIHKMCRMMLHRSGLSVRLYDFGYPGLRSKSAFWLDQLDKWKKMQCSTSNSRKK
jgi:hypothetical protein